MLLDKRVLSTYMLGKKINVTHEYLSSLIEGKIRNPQLDTLEKLSSYFGITISQLIGEEDLNKKEQ